MGSQMKIDGNLNSTFSASAMRAEILDAETETRLALAWRDDRDEKALHRLISAYMRLAISMAYKFRRYGAPINDLVQEAGLGLMKAAEKFDPDRGVRFSTYARWWIKASIQDFVLRNWSLVRTGSTASQKSLFFNLKRIQSRLEREATAQGAPLDNHQLCQKIASEIGVPLRDVEMMQGRLSGSDYSLNTPQSADEEGREWIDALEDDSDQAEDRTVQRNETEVIRSWILDAMNILTERERFVVKERKLLDRPRTLESLGGEMGISKERVRQIEAIAFKKMHKALAANATDVREFLA